jgi:hypothetical protein
VRRQRSAIGFVFQQFNLVDRLPVLTNVCVGALARIPLWRSLLGLFPAAERRAAFDALARVGIEAHAYQRASTLSGGQQQRADARRSRLPRTDALPRTPHRRRAAPRRMDSGRSCSGRIEPAQTLSIRPSANVAALVGAQYYWILHHHPVALLGYMATLEM